MSKKHKNVPPPGSVSVTFEMPEYVVMELDRIAAAQTCGRSYIMRHIIMDALGLVASDGLDRIAKAGAK